jgi:phosphatidylethanolamine/phosphatidyl-N-methylethanolamine N-methyltransferase
MTAKPIDLDTHPRHRFRTLFGHLGVVRDKLLFLGRFLRRPLQISSIAPTTCANARRIVARITKPGRKVVVEFGPGTGVVAKALIESGRLTVDSLCILIERNPDFAEQLTRELRDPRVRIVHDSAENVEAIVRGFGERCVDYFLCSLPLLIMTPTIRAKILSATCKLLTEDGALIVFLFRKRVGRLLEAEFEPIEPMSRLLWNIPSLVLFVVLRRR